jgi:penicillin-binding protein 2
VSTLGSSRAPIDARLERKLAATLLFVCAVWIALIARLFWLQVLQADEFRLSAERNSVRTRRVEATRGIVFDRAGAILVDSRPSFDVLVVPSEVPDVERTLQRVARLVGADPADVREAFGQPRGAERFQALRVAHDLPRDAVARVEDHLFALDGVSTHVAPVRSYVHGVLASHVLGALGEISARQLENRAYAGYRRGDVIGSRGVEAVLDRELRGRPGGVNVLVDAHGRELDRLDEIEPVPGRNVVLTLDLRVQRAAEEALEATGRTGAVVALDPTSGAVLALASRPAFDPNRFAGGIEQAEWAALVGDPLRPLQDRALQGQYPPGSTYKAITAIAGLEERAITPHWTIYCSGSHRLGRRRYRCWKRGGHGEVSLHRALVESCDVYFYQVAQRVGIERLAYYARVLGLGASTGIDLGAEMPGLVPTSAWKQRRFGEVWVEGETLSVGIGQGFNLLTPIQLARTYAAIGNGGTLWRPFVVREIRDPEGPVLERREPTAAAQVPVSEQTLALVRRALRGVVHDPHGTGYAMRGLPGGVEAAGKTGTAQVIALAEDVPEDEELIPIAHRDHAWFVTYVPPQNPRIAVAVVVEHGGHGGSAAAPIARRVVEAFLQTEGIQVARD